MGIIYLILMIVILSLPLLFIATVLFVSYKLGYRTVSFIYTKFHRANSMVNVDEQELSTEKFKPVAVKDRIKLTNAESDAWSKIVKDF